MSPMPSLEQLIRMHAKQTLNFKLTFPNSQNHYNLLSIQVQILHAFPMSVFRKKIRTNYLKQIRLFQGLTVKNTGNRIFARHISRKKLKAQSKIYIIQGLKQNLLGTPEISKLDLIRKVNNIKENNIRDIVSRYPEIFRGIGQFKKELNIEIKENTNPYFQAVPRTVPIPLLPKLKKELDHLLKLKIIKTVDFSTECGNV